MTSHRQIMTNVATAIRDAAAVASYCATNFSRGLDIHVGAYPDGIPTTADAPFLWITPKEENEAVNADEIFTVRMVLGAAVTGTSGEKVINNVITARSASANGLTVNGGNKVVEDLRDLLIPIIRNAKAGARVRTIRRVENDIAHFPLEWAEIFIEYFEPEALV